MNIIAELRFQVKKEALGLWPDASGVVFDLSEPTVEAHGDLALNIAMVLAKKLKKKPMDVATEFVDHIKGTNWYGSNIRNTEIKSPGFINFFLKEDTLLCELGGYVRSLEKTDSKKQKIVIEHTNVNPNKAMHIGHLRNSILGDVINRVLQRTGYDTEVQYYVDDTGVQVAETYLGLQELDIAQNKGEKFDHYCWRVYRAINEALTNDPSLGKKRTTILHELESAGSETAKKVKELATKILKEHLATMWDFKIDYDLLVWESDILGFGFWERALETLKKSDTLVKETTGKNKGCYVIKTGESTEDDEHSADKVIVKSDGSVTYTGKDIAYHLWKYNVLGMDFLYDTWSSAPQKKDLTTTSSRGKKSEKFGNADAVYNVIDVRQSYPQEMVRFALNELGFTAEAESLKHVSYGVVSLSAKTATEFGALVDESKDTHSMSGRKGIGVKIDDLLIAMENHVKEQSYDVTSNRKELSVSPREVALGAIKYFMLRYNPNTEIAFDFNEALTLEGNTGPYIQYAHARASGILEKGEALNMPKIGAVDISQEERRLLKKLYLWPAILTSVSDELNVNVITTYAFELANLFNSFYEANSVLKVDGDLRNQRLALVFGFRAVLADVLTVLGIVAPNKM